MLRRLDGEVEYLAELDRVAKVQEQRKVAESRRLRRREGVRQRNAEEKNVVRKWGRRVKLWLEEVYEIER
jgi:hypothetical protein